MYFTPVWILLLILTSFHPHYDLTLVSFHPTLVRHLQPNSDHLRHLLLPTLQDKLRTQMFRKGATHKLKPSPSDITAIGLSNSVIGLLKLPRNSPKLKKACQLCQPQTRIGLTDPLAIHTVIVSRLPSTIDSKLLWKKVRKLEGAEKISQWPGAQAEKILPLCKSCSQRLQPHKMLYYAFMHMYSKAPCFQLYWRND